MVEKYTLGNLGATRQSLHSVGRVMGASGSFPSTSMGGLRCISAAGVREVRPDEFAYKGLVLGKGSVALEILE